MPARRRATKLVTAVAPFLLVAATGCWQGCAEVKPGSLAALFGELELRSGDLVFRRGRSLASHSVLAVDRDSRFSHVGLLRVEGGVARVIHALPESEDGSGGSIRIDSLDRFLSTRRATAAAIYRLRSEPSAAGEAAAEAAYGYLLAAIPFDEAYDARDDRALYCTELIWAAYREAGVDLVGTRFAEVRTPLRTGSLILPSTLMQSRFLERLQSVSSGDPER